MTDITLNIDDAQGTAQLEGLLTRIQSHVGNALQLDMASQGCVWLEAEGNHVLFTIEVDS